MTSRSTQKSQWAMVCSQGPWVTPWTQVELAQSAAVRVISEAQPRVASTEKEPMDAQSSIHTRTLSCEKRGSMRITSATMPRSSPIRYQ